MRRRMFAVGLVVAVAAGLSQLASAHQISGAIFTTLSNGSEVNLNHFPSKEAVWLDGGPGPGAPATAAGLDDGTYVFQVTDPSGKVLLSQDAAKCRQVVAGGGFFKVTAVNACDHQRSPDLDHAAEGAHVVQLIPYATTPNNGGVYKVWVTRVEDYLLGCRESQKNPGLSLTQALDLTDCGSKEGGNAHGFIPAHSKTDNFKVKNTRVIREIDAVFFRDANNNGLYDWGAEQQLPGLHMIWTDTLGVQNIKHSYYLPMWNIIEAHAEAVEEGVHYVTIPDLRALGCVVGSIYIQYPNQGLPTQYLPVGGPQTIKVDLSKITNGDKDATVQIWVACRP